METININTRNPIEILELLGFHFETSREQNDLKKLTKSIEIANSVNLESFDSDCKATFYYFLGNAWSYVMKIKYPDTIFEFESEEIEKQITFYRMALGELIESDEDLIKCQVLTNLGNLFSHIGRFVEAQEYFNLCLEINPNFGLAIGNRGYGLFHYAKLIFEPLQQYIFLQYARKDLLASCEMEDVYYEAKNDFRSIAKKIETLYPIKDLNDLKKYKNYFKVLADEEVDYRTWCVNNRLFINPLNDVLCESVVAHDYLHTPQMVLKANEKPIYQGMFNQLKQEYVSARYLFYESLLSSTTHYSDKHVVLMDTLDSPVHSLSLEKAKVAFRMSYSIFDKISYFLNLYLDLGNKPFDVSFRKIWFKRSKGKPILNEAISKSSNWALRGLFWLSKDFYEERFNIIIEPEAKELAKIRNFIEHKSFKVVDSFNPKWTQENVTYEIDRDLFENKTLKILKLCRSALMYLSFLIYVEESKRDKFRGDNLIVPVDFIQLNDADKI